MVPLVFVDSDVLDSFLFKDALLALVLAAQESAINKEVAISGAHEQILFKPILEFCAFTRLLHTCKLAR